MSDDLHGLISWLPVGEANYARDDDHDKWVTNIYEPGTVNRLAVVATGMDKGVACWLAIKLNEASKVAASPAQRSDNLHIHATEITGVMGQTHYERQVPCNQCDWGHKFPVQQA